MATFTEIVWTINIILTILYLPLIVGALIGIIQSFPLAVKKFLDICERHWYSKGRVRKVVKEIGSILVD